MARITVKRNWKKKILALTVGNPVMTSYRLDSNFKGIEFTPEDAHKWVVENNTNYRGSDLTYDKETGRCCLHFHSNHWVEWTQKINW